VRYPLSACPGCGAAAVPGRRFRSACGHRLPDAAPPAGEAGPDEAIPAAGERRWQSGGCGRGCSATWWGLPRSPRRDPEVVRELPPAYFGTAREIIGRYGGVTEKFIGDAVMAVWGTPAATEQDAERAVRAALDLVAAVSQLGRDEDVPQLAARAGVVTGQVAVNLADCSLPLTAGPFAEGFKLDAVSERVSHYSC
jgi:hypothetical protein